MAENPPVPPPANRPVPPSDPTNEQEVPPGIVLRFARRPSAWGNMMRALVPSPGLRRVPRVPPMAAYWAPHAAGHWKPAAFHDLTRLPRTEHLPLLYLHVLNFPLQFALLTHPAFPVPIWGLLQVRNHLLLHAPVAPTDPITQEVRVVAQRTGEASTEVDLYSRITRGGELVFEGLNTYWTRLRAGPADPPSPLQRTTAAPEHARDEWRTPVDGGLSFARVSGDFNGVHYARWYARRLGFPGPFLHPQRALAACLQRMADAGSPAPQAPQRLDAWIKGPVFYDAPVVLRTDEPPAGDVASDNARNFALHLRDDSRPALQGRIKAYTPGMALRDADGSPLAP